MDRLDVALEIVGELCEHFRREFDVLASNFEIKNVWSQVVLDHAPLTERESVVLVRSCAKQKLKAIAQSSPTDTQTSL